MIIINKRTLKRILIFVAVIIVFSLIILKITNKSTYDSSEQASEEQIPIQMAYELGEAALEQQIPIMTELFHRNKTTLDDLVLQTVNGPDYDVYYYNSDIIKAPGTDYIPDGIGELLQQLSDDGIGESIQQSSDAGTALNIIKHGKYISIWVYHKTLHGTYTTCFLRITYEYSESVDEEDTIDERYVKLSDNWFLRAANFPGGM